MGNYNSQKNIKTLLHIEIMSSTHAVECPLGASIKDNCKTDSLEFVVLDIDEKETLQLRSGCDAS